MEGSADRAREAVTIVGDNLRVDAVTARVLQAFDSAGVASVLLKGPAIARWLYTHADPRPYRDCDLLVRPSDMERAVAVLESLGFVRFIHPRGLPEWSGEHAIEWWHEEDRIPVDLHSTLAGVDVDDATAWGVLASDTELMVVGGHAARVLAVPVRALHVVLHAAQHGRAFHRPTVDLERALAQVDEPVWHEAVELASRLQAMSAFVAGLRLLPEGQALVVRLALPAEVSVEAALRASSPPPVALGLEQLAQARGVRARAAIAWRKFVPPPEFMRRWSPPASRSRARLATAYLLRTVWILRATPQGARAWLRARRASEPARRDRGPR